MKEVSPNLGRRRFQGDLVETMDFLFVKVVKAKKLPQQNVYVQVVVGDFKAMSECFENKPNPIWNQVFTLSKERIESSSVVLTVRDKYIRIDEYFVGRVVLEIPALLRRVPPDNPLAAEWCSLKNSEGQRARGHLMVTAWMVTRHFRMLGIWMPSGLAVTGSLQFGLKYIAPLTFGILESTLLMLKTWCLVTRLGHLKFLLRLG